MQIYDITREVFSAPVYPGDPRPTYRKVLGYEKTQPDICQVSALQLGSHSGTHLDAPLHFLPGGKDIAQLDLTRAVGECTVCTAKGEITRETALQLTESHPARLLIRGTICITPDSARIFADCGLMTLGVEDLTVGTPQTSPEIHRILLGAEILILESLDLSAVPDGNYFLSAAPLKMAGLDGSPIRALLIDGLL